ncbi:hypothetical protein D3C76_1015990 [compost metagenome]
MDGGDTDTDGEGNALAGMQHRGPGEFALDAPGENDGLVEGGIAQHHRELFAAHAPGCVGLAQLGAEDRREMPQRLVAHGMPPAIVDRLEVVQVEHQDGRAMARGAPHPGQLGFELLHEVPTVGQLGEGVGGGEYLQLGFDLLALGDIGNEAVPQHAAILQPPRACIALAPGRIPLRQLHPVLQVPGRQLAGGDVEGSEVRRQVIRVDDRVQGFRVSRQLLRGKPVDIPNPGTGVGEEGPAVSQAPVLEDHAGNLVGQVGHQCGGLLHLLGHDAHGGNVRGGPDHAQRLAGDIAIDHLAAAADPLVAAVPATQPMLHFV